MKYFASFFFLTVSGNFGFDNIVIEGMSVPIKSIEVIRELESRILRDFSKAHTGETVKQIRLLTFQYLTEIIA